MRLTANQKSLMLDALRYYETMIEDDVDLEVISRYAGMGKLRTLNSIV